MKKLLDTLEEKSSALRTFDRPFSGLLLITGANGFVGQALCHEAIRRGMQIRGATRTICQLPPCVEPVVTGSIDESTGWGKSLQGVETIIHLAARVHVMKEKTDSPLAEFRRVNVAGTECLARSAAASGVNRLVYVSSIKVNGEKTIPGHRYSECDRPAPQDHYGVSKWEAEQALHRVAEETGLEIVIVRPPLVYGAGVKGNFAQMLNALVKGIPLPLASVSNKRSLIYLENFVDVLLLCASHTAAAGQTFLVCDGEDVSTPDLLRRLGESMGYPPCLLPCPVVLLKFFARMVGRSNQIERLLSSLQIDGGKISRELGWQPPYTLQQGLKTTAEYYRDFCRE